MIDNEAAIAYFEELAKTNKKILHDPDVSGRNAFLHGDIDELLNDISGTNSDGYVMLLEIGSGIIFGDNQDNAMDRADIALIICRVVKEGDKDEQRLVEKESKEIATFIMGKMKKDSDRPIAFLKEFDLLSVRYQKIFGFGNNHFGWRAEFNLMDTANINHDPDQWL